MTFREFCFYWCEKVSTCTVEIFFVEIFLNFSVISEIASWMVSRFVVLLYQACDGLGHHATDGQPFAYALANLGAADVVAACLDERHTGGQRLCIDGRILAGIDNDGIVAENVVVVIPAVEQEPVVGPDDEGEAVLRIAGRQGLQRVPCV